MSKTLEQKNAAFELMTAMLKVLELHGLATDRTPWNLTMNFHGPARRLDIATVTPDGQQLEQWLLGLNMNLVDLEAFGTPVMLPAQGGTVQ